MVLPEEVLSELRREDLNKQGLPPGFRFHPTDEELIIFYLASKVFNGASSGVDIAEVDLNRCEPWELPDVAKMGENEWYFFSLRDRKYPAGIRTNRATGNGYWKATGKDREVDSTATGVLLGMKKTLVFYRGRAPKGEKTKWVMHEYRLDGDFSPWRRHRRSSTEEWVICRIFHKNGEKRRSYVMENNSSPKVNSSPSLLKTPATTFSDPNLDRESEFKDHLSNGFQSFHQPSFLSSFSSTAATNRPSQAVFTAALLSDQDYYLKEDLTVIQQYKTEPNFSHFQNDFEQQPFVFEMDSSAQRTYSGAASDGGAFGTFTSIPVNMAGVQMMLDFPIRLPAESWSLDF